MVATTEQQQNSTGYAESEPSLHHLREQLRTRAMEFGAYAKYMVALRIDRLKLTATRIVIYAALGIAALIVASAVLVFGTGLLLLGLAGLIGYLVGSFWLGATILGFLVLAGLSAAAWIALRMHDKRTFAALRKKYADIRQKQKAAFGRDIKEVANAR